MASKISADPQGSLLSRSSASLLPELRCYIDRHRQLVEEMIREGGAAAGRPASVQYARAFDGLFAALFQAVHGVLQSSGRWQPVTLSAVGSYGRGAVAFRSDLDVRLLCAGRTDAARPIAEALLYPLWDAGLSIGHQVVTVSDMIELSRRDLPTATSVLDWRTLAGDPKLTDRMLSRAFEGIFGPGTIHRFLENLAVQAGQRFERYGDSVYLLEPDVKNGQGGLRDLDIAHWAARARWRVRSVRELVQVGVLVPREWQQIEAARDFLWRVRNLLHFHTGRRSDRLSFDYQEVLAEVLGYGSGGQGVERFMSDYYRQARVIARARETLLARAEPPPRRRPRERVLGNGLKLTNDCLSIEDAAALERDPALSLRLYTEAVRRDVPIYNFAREAVARAVSSPSFCERLRQSPEAAQHFRRLVRVAQRTKLREGSVLKELHDVGLLLAMIPEFAPVVGRVHHDIYHVYTVDVHSVAAVDKLRALVRGELATEHPLASRLAAEVARPHVLFFATLLHDVGKDIGGRNHSQRGFELVATILRRLQVAEADIREVQHLVLKHLRMYHVATRRDIDDPKTVEGFCQEVHGHEGLKELYLLTLADVSTTSPTALTSWKARMLEDLYVGTERKLQGLSLSGEERAEELRQEVLALCPAAGEREFLRHYLRAMPERYLYANQAQEIVRHSRFARQAQTGQFSVTVMTVDEPYVELGFIAEDRPGLLAAITAALAAARIKVVGAQIYSWKDSYGRARALDLFWVRSGLDASAVASALPKIERNFERLLNQELRPEELVEGRGGRSGLSVRPAPKVMTQVSFDNRSASEHTVLEITTQDKPGLLFWLSNSLQQAGLTISLAKINTEGHQVADVFYVTDATGGKVTDPARVEDLKGRILSTIAQLQKGL